MNVLVTGGSGFIGSHVIDVLVESGHLVTNLDKKPPYRSDITHRSGSISDKELLDEEVGKADVVYHIGGFSNIDLVKESPVETIEMNVLSTLYLLDACRKKGIKRFLYASSVYACERKGHLYTTSKFASERIIEDYGKLYGIPYTILRYATVYGPRNRSADVVYLFTKAAKYEGCIEIHGDGKQSRNFTHVRDVAEGSAAALQRESCVNRTVVIAVADRTSINELAQKVVRIVNPKCRIVHKESPRCQDYIGEVEGIEESDNCLEWISRVSLDEGISEMESLV